LGSMQPRPLFVIPLQYAKPLLDRAGATTGQAGPCAKGDSGLVPVPDVKQVVNAPVESGTPDNLRVIYFKRSADGGKVEEALENAGIPITNIVSSAETAASNILTCSPDIDISIVKTIASNLIKSGVVLRAIWHPIRAYSAEKMRMSIEFYPNEFAKFAKPLTLEQVDNMTVCDISNTPFIPINVEVVGCSSSYDFDIAYYDSRTKKFIITHEEEIEPGTKRRVTDNDGANAVTSSTRVYYRLKPSGASTFSHLGRGDITWINFRDGSRGAFYARSADFMLTCS
jgi:hypothetical protein